MLFPAWAALQPTAWPSPDRSIVPFLPVNPELSSTRNQGRQKLARLNAREFAILIIDILSDAKRRQTSPAALSHGRNQLGRRSEVSDDEPLYDSVASDDDYVTAASLDTLSALSAVPSLGQCSSDDKETTPGPSANGSTDPKVEELLKKQLEVSETRLDTMTQEIRALQATVSFCF
jgi:hypothetical protein